MTQGISLNDIGLTLYGMVRLKYDCPRCGKVNTRTMDAYDLIFQVDLECDNPACGRGNFWMFVSMDGTGSYKDINDAPLLPPTTATLPVVVTPLPGN